MKWTKGNFRSNPYVVLICFAKTKRVFWSTFDCVELHSRHSDIEGFDVENNSGHVF